MPRKPKVDQNTNFADVVNDIVNANAETDLVGAHPASSQTTAAELLDQKFIYTCKVKRFAITLPEDAEEYAQLTTDAINGKIIILTERFSDDKMANTFVVLKYLTMTPKLLPPKRDPTQF